MFSSGVNLNRLGKKIITFKS